MCTSVSEQQKRLLRCYIAGAPASTSRNRRRASRMPHGKEQHPRRFIPRANAGEGVRSFSEMRSADRVDREGRFLAAKAQAAMLGAGVLSVERAVNVLAHLDALPDNAYSLAGFPP